MKLSFNRGTKVGKFARIAVALLVIATGAFLISKLFARTSTSASSNSPLFSAKNQQVNREFSFPLKDASDKEVGKIKFIIEKVESLDEIIVKGQKAKAVEGRMFLIANIKIVNDFNKSIEINTRDYVRLSVNKKEDELLAPDIHNDPVEVQAISTKYTRIGFPVNTSDRDFVLQIGEIKGDKQKVELDLN